MESFLTKPLQRYKRLCLVVLNDIKYVTISISFFLRIAFEWKTIKFYQLSVFFQMPRICLVQYSLKDSITVLQFARKINFAFTGCGGKFCTKLWHQDNIFYLITIANSGIKLSKILQMFQIVRNHCF